MKYLGKLNLEDKKVKERLGRGKNLTHISLFTGIGGFDIGFAKAGIKTRVMVEFDKYCCQTLRANFFWSELKQRKENGKIVWIKITPDSKDIKKIVLHPRLSWNVYLVGGIRYGMGLKRKEDTVGEILISNNLSKGITNLLDDQSIKPLIVE